MSAQRTKAEMSFREALCLYLPEANSGTIDAICAAHAAALEERAAQVLLQLQRVTKPDGPIFLEWVADRLVHQYGERPSVDFVQALRRLASEWEQRAAAAEARCKEKR